MLSKKNLIIIGSIIVIAIIYFNSVSENLLQNCNNCPKCKDETMVRPDIMTRVGCDSSKCRCYKPKVYELSKNIKLNCRTCEKCKKNLERPNRTINTTATLGCNDKKCKCIDIDM
jgi:hypothetical protein